MKLAPLFWLTLCTGCLSLSHCSPPPAPAETPAPKDPPPAFTLIGRVVSISHDAGFVLIERLPSTSISIGTNLSTRSSIHPHSANLLFTGEAKGNYIAADIQSGHTQVGDDVGFFPLPDPSNPPNTSPSPETSPPAETSPDSP